VTERDLPPTAPAQALSPTAELRLMLILVFAPALIVLVGCAMSFSVLILSVVFGPSAQLSAGVPVAEDPQLEFLRANDCILADVRNGQARLYRCDSGEGPVHLTPEQVRRLVTEQEPQEDHHGAI